MSGSSAATESQRVGRHWSDPDLLYPPRLARGRHSPARTHGGVRPAPAALRGAAAVGPQVLGYEFAWKLRLRRSVQNSLPTSVWKQWISSIVEPQAHNLGSQAARSGDFMTPSARSGITRTGDLQRIPRKEREFLRALPNVCQHPAVRRAPPCLSSGELSGVVGSAALTTPPVSRGWCLAPRRRESFARGTVSQEEPSSVVARAICASPASQADQASTVSAACRSTRTLSPDRGRRPPWRFRRAP